MEGVSKPIKQLSKTEIFEGMKEILHEVAESKIVDEITMDTSLVEDFAFDSIDIMGTLLKIQERFFKGNATMELEKFLDDSFSDDKLFIIGGICDEIEQMAREGR